MSEDLLKLRALKSSEMDFLKSKRFFATALLNKFLKMKCDAAAYDCMNAEHAYGLSGKVNAIIKKIGFNRYLGAVSEGSTLFIYKAIEEEIPEVPENIELDLKKGRGQME